MSPVVIIKHFVIGHWVPEVHKHAAVGIAMAAATFRFMQATAKTAMRYLILGVQL
jgi:hypothetical protein